MTTTTTATIPKLYTLAAIAFSKHYTDESKLSKLLFGSEQQELALSYLTLEFLIRQTECSEKILKLLSKKVKPLETFDFCSSPLKNEGLQQIGGTTCKRSYHCISLYSLKLNKFVLFKYYFQCCVISSH
jgi:hypothetical protein